MSKRISCGVAFLMLFVGASMAEPKGVDQTTWPQRRADFYTRVLVEAYRQGDNCNEQWDAKAEQLINRYSIWKAYEDCLDAPRGEDVPDLPHMIELAKEVNQTGCDAPLIQWISYYFSDDFFNATSDPIWAQAHVHIKPFKEPQTPAMRYLAGYLMAHRTLQVMELQNWASRDWRRDRWWYWCNDLAWVFSDRGPKLEPAEQQVLARMFVLASDDLDHESGAALLEATKNPRETTQWLAHIVRGSIFRESAWAARGGGWASEVKRQGWLGFNQYSDMSRQEYEAAWRLDPTLAEPAVRMISVGMGRGGDEAVWFQRAIQADPHDGAPYGLMLWANRPRWGGNYAKLYAIGETALTAGDFRSEVPDNFYYALKNLLDEDADDWLIFHAARIWPAVERYVQARAQQPSATHTLNNVYSYALGFAFLFDRPADIRKYFELLDRDPNRLVDTMLMGVDMRWQLGWAYAQLEPAAHAAIVESIKLSNQQDHERACEILQAAFGQAQDPWALKHLKDRYRLERWAIQYEKGQWVDLLAHRHEGWRPTRGIWTHTELLPDSPPMHAIYRDEGGMRMICGLQLGTNYEAELRVKVYNDFHKGGWGGVGFLIDPQIGKGSRYHRMVCLARYNENSIWIQDPESKQSDDVFFGKKVPEKEMTLTMKFEDGRVQAWVNQDLVCDGYKFAPTGKANGLLGIGAFHSGSGQAYEFLGLKVRKTHPAHGVQ